MMNAIEVLRIIKTYTNFVTIKQLEHLV